MATYVNDLRLKEIATGDESGTWGTSTNTNLELIAEAFSFGTEAITTNADTHTTTIADGSTDPGRSIYLKYTGTLDSACTITIGPNTVSKLWFIENGTSGSQNIIISQGSGANVTIPAGHVKAVYSDGAGSGATIVDAFTDLNLAGTTTVSVLSVSSTTTFSDDVTFTGASNNLVWDKSDDCLEFADNAKAKFGASDDLQIYHDGSNSRIQEGGTGSLLVRGTNLQLQDSDGFDYLTCTDGGDGGTVVLKHLGSAVLSTASGGVTVTGTLTADDLEIDSGTLSVDASNNRVGINETSPTAPLHIAGSTGFFQKLVGTSASGDVRIQFDAGGTTGQIQYAGASHASVPDTLTLVTTADIRTVHNGSTRVTIKADGDTGIGQTAPNSPLEIVKNITFSSADTFPQLLIRTASGSTGDQLGFGVDTANSLAFIQATERGTNVIPLVLQRYGGNVGIGLDSPEQILHIKDTSNPDTTSGSVIIEGQRDGTANLVQLRAKDNSSPSSALPNNQGGIVRFTGFDGTDFAELAGIQFNADGQAVADGDSPGRLVFLTTSDGSGSATEKMRIDSEGNILMNKTSHNSNNTQGVDITKEGAVVATNDGGVSFLGNRTSSDGQIILLRKDNTTTGSIGTASSGMTFGSGSSGTERMRIVDDGTVCINATDSGSFDTKLYVEQDQGSANKGPAIFTNPNTGTAHRVVTVNTGGNSKLIVFDKGFSSKGSISTNGTSTAYNTTSDYRLKENINYTWDATTRLKQLKPARFNFIEDETNTLVDGFIAHEVSSIVPEAVTGAKDAVDGNGNAIHQEMDAAKLIPLLVKTIQELEARITALES